MPIRLGPSWALLLMMALVVSCAPQAEQEEAQTPTAVDAEAAVRAVAESWDPMMNSGDLDGIVSLFAQDAVRLNAGAPPVIGSEAIRKSFQEAFDGASFDSSNPVDEIRVVDEWAFARGTYTDRATDKASGETTEDVGKWVSVFRKTSDGWKFAIDIWNRDAPSTAAMDLEAERKTPVLPEAITMGGSPDEEAVLAVTEAWDTAHNTDDIDALMGLYTADAHRMNPDEPDQVGPDAIRAGFENELAGVKIEGAAQVFGIRVAGDWASVWGTWSATESDDETNEQMEDGGNWLGIMKRTPEGWKFYLDIWNRDA